jgi:hypothetical protein
VKLSNGNKNKAWNAWALFSISFALDSLQGWVYFKVPAHISMPHYTADSTRPKWYYINSLNTEKWNCLSFVMLMSQGAFLLLEDPQASLVRSVLRIALKMKVSKGHWWNDTDRGKPRCWGRNTSQYRTEISLNVARNFSSFGTVNTGRLHTKTDHLMLFRQMVLVFCENRTKHIIHRFVMLKWLVHIVTTVLERAECGVDVKLPIWIHWFAHFTKNCTLFWIVFYECL